MTPNSNGEQINTSGENLSQRVREVIHEEKVSRIIVKNPEGHTIIEIPVTVGVIGALIAPVAAAVGAIWALVAHCTIEVERSVPANQSNSKIPLA
jgi:hypothetical protein